MQAKKNNLEKFFKLEMYRRKYGLTQLQMAKLLGVCESSYNHKVNRITPFTYDEMIIMLDELNKRARLAGDVELTLNDLFGM